MIKLNIDLLFKKNIKVLNVDEDHPIGSLYLTEESENPSIKKGGTWIKLNDTYLYGVSSGVGSNIGANNVSLTSNQNGPHIHNINFDQAWSFGGTKSIATTSGGPYGGAGYIQSSGNGEAHNNMPSSRKIYIYKRTA